MLANGWRIFKSSVSIGRPNGRIMVAWESQSIEVLVSAQVLEMVERESVRRAVVHCGEGKGLLV